MSLKSPAHNPKILCDMKVYLLSVVVALASGITYSSNQLQATAPIGKGLYEQKGSNSCVFCHGIQGHDGSVKDAANLSQPKTWKAWKALGGNAAFSKDKTAFLKKLSEATVHLIEKGAVVHNKKNFVRDWYSWQASGSYNTQMLGVRGAPSAKWIKRYKNRGMTGKMAAASVYKYIQILDKQGVFEKPPMTKP